MLDHVVYSWERYVIIVQKILWIGFIILLLAEMEQQDRQVQWRRDKVQ